MSTEGVRGAHLYTFAAQETQDSPRAVPPEMLARLYCHAIVSALPYEALPEVVDDLRDLENRFLISSQTVTQPVSPSQGLKARLGSPLSRPEIQLTGE